MSQDGAGSKADSPQTHAQAAKESHPPMRGRPQGGEECGPSCRERRMLWKEELSSLSTLVGTVATLLAVITPQ
jgi:hypothetical protein